MGFFVFSVFMCYMHILKAFADHRSRWTTDRQIPPVPRIFSSTTYHFFWFFLIFKPSCAQHTRMESANRIMPTGWANASFLLLAAALRIVEKYVMCRVFYLLEYTGGGGGGRSGGRAHRLKDTVDRRCRLVRVNC